MYLPRTLEHEVLKASSCYPVVMVCGPNQAGKSTMLNHIREPERRCITMDDIRIRTLAEKDPVLFFESFPPPLLIEEFQRVPSVLLELKRIVDLKKLAGEDCNGLYWLTSSQKFHMMRDVSEALAGRAAILELSSLSQAELDGRPGPPFHPDLNSLRERIRVAGKKDVRQIFEQIFQGGMPELRTTLKERERFYIDFVESYLSREISGLAQIGKMTAFSEFLLHMAANTAQELRYEQIASAVGISAPTAKEWVSILERSGILYILRPWFSKDAKRLLKTPKAYFVDTGLAAFLTRWPNAETLQFSNVADAFLETWVISEIVKSYCHAGKSPDLWYYRDKDQKEIDLLVVEGDRIYPMEIKMSGALIHADRNFRVLEKFPMDVQPGIVLCLADEMLPCSRKAWLYPVWGI